MVLIIPGFPKDEQDTSCLTFSQIYVLELKRQGRTVSIISLHYPYTSEEYTWNGISVYPMNGRNKRLKRKFFLYGKVRKAFKHIQSLHEVGAIHAFWLNEATVYAQRLEDEFEIPSIGASVGQDSRPENGYLKKIDRTKKITCSCSLQAEMLSKSGFGNVEVIPLGINCEGTYEKTLDLVGVGSLIELKNFGFFIDLCIELKKSKPDFTAVLVGSGAQKDMLQEKIEKNELAQNVELLGQLEYDQTLEKIGTARLLVHPSTYEGFGMIIIEALALGTHVLASPVGIAKDLKEVNHLTFSIHEDVKQMERLLSLPAPAPAVYGIESTVNGFNQIYNSF